MIGSRLGSFGSVDLVSSAFGADGKSAFGADGNTGGAISFVVGGRLGSVA